MTSGASTSGRAGAPPLAPAAAEAAWRRHRRSLLAAAATVAAAYAAYRYYSLSGSGSGNSSGGRSDRPPGTLRKYLLAAQAYASALSSASVTASTVAADLQAFLTGDAEAVPGSLAQLGKLLGSGEAQALLRSSAAAVASGVADGVGGALAQASAAAGASHAGASALETVLQALLSDRGHSLLGVAVGVASKNVSAALVEFMQGAMQAHAGAGVAHAGGGRSDTGDADTGTGMSSGSMPGMAGILRMLVSDDGDRLLSLLVTKSVGTAVSTYCEAYAGVNVYADMVEAIVKREHRDALSDVLTRTTAAFCKEVAAALRRVQQQQQHAGGIGGASAAAVAGPLGYPPGAGDEPGGGGGAGVSGVSSSRLSLDGLTTAASGDHGALSPVAAGRKPSKPLRVGGGMAGAASRHNNAARLPTLPAPPPAVWVRQLADLAREKEVRSLAVEVAGSAMRESVHGFVTGLSEVVSLPSLPSSVGSLPTAYVALAIACVVIAYMLGAVRAVGMPIGL